MHIGTQAFAAAGTNEWHILTWIKDADCDPVVEIMSRASRAEGRGYLPELRPPEVWWPSFFTHTTSQALRIQRATVKLSLALPDILRRKCH